MMADRDECRCEGCGLPNEYCYMLQRGMCGTNAELSTAWDKLELAEARLLELANYVNALAEDCDKQSVYLHIHGITDPWAESRKLFDQLPIIVRALLGKLRAEGEESK